MEFGNTWRLKTKVEALTPKGVVLINSQKKINPEALV